MTGEGRGDVTDEDDVGAGDVEQSSGRGGQGEAAEDEGIGVTLPDEIDGGHGEVDGMAAPDLEADVGEDAVAGFDGVVEAEVDDACAERIGAVLEGALAAEDGLSIFADGADGVVFGAAAGGEGNEGVDVARGEGGKAGVAEAVDDVTGQEDVHGPGEGSLAGGAEFAAGGEDDVFDAGQGSECLPIEQVEGVEVDAGVFKEGGDAGFAEAGGGVDLLRGGGGANGALDAEREGRPHFAAGAEDEEVAAEGSNRGDVLGGGQGEEVFEFGFRLKSVHEGKGTLAAVFKTGQGPLTGGIDGESGAAPHALEAACGDEAEGGGSGVCLRVIGEKVPA